MENKKIGIVTFHTADNYGAVYQCYALQQYLLNNVSSNVEVIDYCTNKHINAYNILRKRSNHPLKNIYRNFYYLMKYFALKARKSKFKDFRNTFIRLSNVRYATEEEFLNSTFEYDYCITGSDQVFQPYIEDYRAFYLNFRTYEGKKIAYAPSFGIKDFNDNVRDIVTPLISSFSHLSCRETDGAIFLSSLKGQEVPVVLDPIFLLSKEEWFSIIPKRKYGKRYILVYDLNGGNDLIKLSKQIANTTGYAIKCVTGNVFNKYSGIEVIYSAGPLDMLSLIQNAEYVITDSFHGTAMSICFKKKFLTYIASINASSRILSLLKLLNLESHIVDRNDSIDIEKLLHVDCDNKLDVYRKKSQEYILNSFD